MIEHQQNALLGVGSQTAWTHGENVPGEFLTTKLLNLTLVY